MAKINIGNLALSKAYLGEQEIDKIYLGDTLLYSSMPQLATPTISFIYPNIVIEEVENAEYYDIYVDGVLEETIDLTGFSVTFVKSDEYGHGSETTIVYNEYHYMDYSLDDGVTWIPINEALMGTTITSINQIKVRCYGGSASVVQRIYFNSQNVADIIAESDYGTGMDTSQNITLNANVTLYVTYWDD